MSFDILNEASKLAYDLNELNVEWAFVGGIAVGIYGFVRATEDIDIIIKEPDLPKIDKALEEKGYLINNSPNVFKDGFKCFRRLKFDKEDEFFSLDILTHHSLSERYLKNRIQGQLDKTNSYVISKTDLIEMKKSANRIKDQLDIESLKDE